MAEQLRKIQHDAYYGVYKAAAITDLQLTFMARGAPCLTLSSTPGRRVVEAARSRAAAAPLQEREKFFTTLRNGLHISPDQHHALLSKLEQDESVNRIRCAPRARRCRALARASAPCAVEP